MTDYVVGSTGPVTDVLTGTDTITVDSGDLVAGDNLTGSGVLGALSSTLQLVDVPANATTNVFDLTLPTTLNGFTAVELEGGYQTVTLRPGFPMAVSLGPGTFSNETVTLANPEDSFNGGSSTGDVINVTNALLQAGVQVNGGSGSNLVITPNALGETQDLGEVVALGAKITNISYATLDLNEASFNPGQQGPGLIYVNPTTLGADVVQLTGATMAAVDDGTSSAVYGDSYFLTPQAGDLLTFNYIGAPTENIFGFDTSATIVLAAGAQGFQAPSSTQAAASLSAVSDAGAIGGAPGVLVTVSQTIGGSVESQSFQFYGSYNPQDFTLTAPSSTNPAYTLAYTGAAASDVGLQTNFSISGVPDVFLAAGQFTSGDAIATTPGGTLFLIGPGSFVLNASSVITGVATIDAAGNNQTITLDRQMGSVTLNLDASGNTPTGGDVIFNVTDLTKIAGGASSGNFAATTSDQINGLTVDLGSGGGNTIEITDQNYSLTLGADPNLKNVQTFAIVGDGGVTFSTGAYQSMIDVDIATGSSGGTPGPDVVTLTYAGDSASDFYFGNTINFDAAGQSLDIETSSSGGTDTLVGFDQGPSQNDVIRYSGADALSVSAVRGQGETTLTVTGDASGTAFTQTFVVQGDYVGNFTASPDGGGGYDIEYANCFMAGTRISAPTGDVAIENLAQGDLVLLHDGRTAPVLWVGVQTVARRFADPLSVLPVRICADALGPGVPRRDLLLSPGHAVFLDGLLVNAAALINGSSVLRDRAPPETFRYFHIELASHGLVLAEGLPAETYLETAERTVFDNSMQRPLRDPDAPRAEEMPFPRIKSPRQLPLPLRARLRAWAEPPASPARSAA